MKYLILFLALVVPVFSQVESAINDGSNINQSAFRAALAVENVDNTSDADKPVSTATQTALDDEKRAKFPPSVLSRFGDLASNNYSNGTPPNFVSILAIGDSLGNRVFDQLRPLILSQFPVVGLGLESLRYKTISGTITEPGSNSTTNFDPDAWDTGRVWAMADGAVMHVGRFLGGTDVQGFEAKTVTIIAAKQAGGGDIVCEYSVNNGSSWTSLGSNIVTDGTDNEAATGEFTVVSTRRMLVRLTASGGPVNLVGAVMVASERQGIILAVSNNGGLGVATLNQGSATVRAAVCDALAPTVLLTQFDSEAGLSQSSLNTFFDNWLTALGDNVPVVWFKQHRTSPTDTAAATMAGLFDTAAATRYRLYGVDEEACIGGIYRAYEAGYRDPGANPITYPDEAGTLGIHLHDNAYRVIAAQMFADCVSGISHGWKKSYQSGSGSIYELFADQAEQTAGTASFKVRTPPGDQSAVWGYYWDRGNGFESYWRWYLAPTTDANASRGMRLEHQGTSSARAPISFDELGYTYFGPYSATFQSAYDLGAQVVVDASSSTKGCLLLNHTSASATWIQRWQLEGVTQAEMREDGELNLKTITTPAAYADDTAAGAAGIPVGGIYRKTDGTVAWRQS